MNCLNGYFHFPYFNSLAEELLKAEEPLRHPEKTKAYAGEKQEERQLFDSLRARRNVRAHEHESEKSEPHPQASESEERCEAQ